MQETMDLTAKSNFISMEMAKYMDKPFPFTQDGIEVTCFSWDMQHLFDAYFTEKYEELQKPKSSLRNIFQWMNQPDPKWIIKGVIPEKGIGSIYGASGCGKSFLTVDMAYCISNGHNWFGLEVKKHPVVYMCLEGSEASRKRHRALSLKYKGDSSFMENARVFTDGFSITSADNVEKLIADINIEFESGCVIIIDTMNAASDGISENDSKDMTSLLNSAKRLKEGCNSVVILVHHTGKEDSKGMRGHSSLFAAMDVVIEVKKDDGVHTWSTTKSKDSLTDKDMKFKLKQVDTSFNGEESDSCMVFQIDEDQSEYIKDNKYTNAILKALKILKDHVGNGTIFPSIECNGNTYLNQLMFRESEFSDETKEILYSDGGKYTAGSIRTGICRAKGNMLKNNILVEHKYKGVTYIGTV